MAKKKAPRKKRTPSPTAPTPATAAQLERAEQIEREVRGATEKPFVTPGNHFDAGLFAEYMDATVWLGPQKQEGWGYTLWARRTT